MKNVRVGSQTASHPKPFFRQILRPGETEAGPAGTQPGGGIMLKRRFENIITYLTHSISNATSESINANIQWVKYTARGFRNKQNFINAIYFHCGGLDLAPASH